MGAGSLAEGDRPLSPRQLQGSAQNKGPACGQTPGH